MPPLLQVNCRDDRLQIKVPNADLPGSDGSYSDNYVIGMALDFTCPVCPPAPALSSW